MAVLRAVIDLNNYGIGKLSKITTNQYTNNISKNPKTNEIKVIDNSLTDMSKNDGMKVSPYQMVRYSDKVTYLKDDSSYNGYMYGLADSSGYYPLELYLYGTNIFKLIFYFDKTTQQYPKHYKVTYLDGTSKEFNVDENSEEFNSEELSITILFQSGTDTTLPQKVLFDYWNIPNYNASIIFIDSFSAKLELTTAYISNVNSVAEQSTNAETIQYGCLANTGSISLIDYNGALLKYAQYGYLDISAFQMILYYKEKIYQYHIPTSSPYFSEENNFEVNLGNSISLWNNINMTSDKTYTTSVNLYTILKDIFKDCLPVNDDEIDKTLTTIINIGNSEMSIKNYLEKIIVPPFTLKKSSLLTAINKICTIAQLNCIESETISEENYLRVKFFNARPIITNEERNNALVITPDNLQEKPVLSILVSNRYDGVIIE